jgi:acyl-coenzyme A synthetase/AMP-(fatty) acid ligase
MATVQANMSDYEAERQNFRWEAPEHFNFAVDVIGKWAADPKKEAMWWIGPDGQERHITFAEFQRKSNQAADAFGKLGIKQGDRVLVMLPRLVEWWEIVLGLMKLGAVPIPCTVLLTPKDIQYRAETAEASAIITDSENAPKYDEVRDKCPSIRGAIIVGNFRPRWTSYAEVAAEGAPNFKPTPTKSSDPCLIYFTSGTVGYPKMVLHTHASYGIGHTITGKYWLDLRPDDLHWNVSETGWAKAAWSNLFGPWSQGAAMFIQDARGKFNPKETLSFLATYPITTFCAPPTVYRLLVLEDLKAYPPKALRHCVGAGEPLNPEVIATWHDATGLTIRDGYGQTETVLICGNFPPLTVKPGSMGKPSPGFSLSIIDDEGNELPPNKEGDIAIKIKPNRPLGLFQEYWKNPDAMARSFKGDWYITGDRAYKDEDGYFWFVGRADDVIISAGYRIGPFEVESALVEHPAVAESAVVASPDEVRGEIVKAYVILAPGYTASEKLAEELQEHVKSVTAPYKYPREIEFVTELPKTISGKIRRVELRERERARKAGK